MKKLIQKSYFYYYLLRIMQTFQSLLLKTALLNNKFMDNDGDESIWFVATAVRWILDFSLWTDSHLAYTLTARFVEVYSWWTDYVRALAGAGGIANPNMLLRRTEGSSETVALLCVRVVVA